ncbi:MAG: FMN-binding glutamate synthase family protein, partial [Ignavibacteriae bacterium]|nr:FMN-binding glutamate synthase family protein [Ignavibacteriota bacterium]
NKAERAASFHKETIKSFVELIAAAGVSNPNEITKAHINRRVSMNNVMKYDELYLAIEAGSFLNENTTPEFYKKYIFN